MKHALAYLRLIANPDDDTAFARVVNFPTRGIGARSLESLQDAARTYNGSLYGTVSHLGGKPRKAIEPFIAMIEKMRMDTASLSLPEAVDHVLHQSGLREHYESQKAKEGSERLENLDELISAAANFVAEAQVQDGAIEHPLLADFLAHASLEAGDHQADAGEDAVQLMTVHAAKGLEFDVVFLTGLEEGLFPHDNSVREIDGLEEERRLMYVAVTRARQRLYVSLAQSRMLHGQTRYCMRSRFLDEIPVGLTKWLTPQQSASKLHSPSAGYGSGQRRAASTPVQASRDLNGLKIGQAVQHARFGVGTIVSAEGSGADARIQINFGPNGMKWLLLGVAKLEPV